MSIRTEIDRITIAKNAIKSAIERKNVPMTDGTSIDEYASYIDLIDNNPQLQDKVANPNETIQHITADSEYYGLHEVTINAISNTYVGSGINRVEQDDLVEQDGILNIPSGFYPQNLSYEVGSGGTTYSVVPKTETWQHNTYVTISVDIGADGSVSAYKSAGGGTANNMVICYPQSDTYVADNEITKIPFPNTPGEHTIPVTIWWDNQNGEHQDHNNYTLTYTVVAKSGGSIDVQPLSITSNGTYTAPDGVAYSPVTVNVASTASNFYTGTGTPASTFGSVGDFFFVTG